MPKQIMESRVNKAIELAKSKNQNIISCSKFYFDFYYPHERLDPVNDAKFTYLDIFNYLEEKEMVKEDGLVWRVHL